MSRLVLGLSTDATKGPPTPSGTITRPFHLLDYFLFLSVWMWKCLISFRKYLWPEAGFQKAVNQASLCLLDGTLSQIMGSQKSAIQTFKSLLIPQHIFIISLKLIANESVVVYLGQSKQRKEGKNYNLVKCFILSASLRASLFCSKTTLLSLKNSTKRIFFGANTRPGPDPEWNVQLIFYGSLFY